ncbi:MAG TPA: SIMPL domain-containing protein [Polyangia bacterium]|nr:SIMPL domain-containing protein [Polyangia bacterium]
MSRPVLVLWIFCALPFTAVAQEQTPASIAVAGTGEVAAIPDLAEIDAGVTAQASTAREAARQNAQVMAGVIDAVRAQGISERDVQTGRFGVSPVYDSTTSGGSRARIAGYRVTNQVHLRVRDLDKLGALLDTLLAAGANELGGVRFTVAEPESLLDKARVAAVADARRKAALYAREAGVSLGRVLHVEELGGAGPPPQMGFARMQQAETAVMPGEVGLSASVRVTFAIE